MKRPIFLLLALGLSLPGNGRVRLPSLVGSGMVLQRNSDARIWGRAEPGRRVTVTPSWGAEPAAVRADGSGRWSVRIETPDAGGPHTLTIDDGDPLVLDDILIGEVWLCSGQSNMEMPLRGFDSQPVNGSLETAMLAGEHPEIRLFRVSRAVSHEPQEDCTGTWQVSSMRSASGFSAVGYHFGLCLARALGIPIGLIESDWGATRIEAWMSREAARNVRHDILATDAEHDPQNRTGALYNAMIRPLTPYTLRGFVWYQGESNKGCHADYARNMAAMVAEWRDAWGGGERMPFYYVQLAPFDYDIPMHRFRGERNPVLLPLLVEAQLRALELIPNADMAVNTDLGDAREIHPPGKRIVGQRLALLALAGTYGLSGIDSRGPQFESVSFGEGRAVVTFRSESTLHPVDDPLEGFEIAGSDRVFQPAEPRVLHRGYDFSRQGEVRSDAVREPVAVRYAFRNVVGDVNLTNTAGLPAFPFRTDDWDDAVPARISEKTCTPR